VWWTSARSHATCRHGGNFSRARRSATRRRNRPKENIVHSIPFLLAAGIAALATTSAAAQGSDPNLARNLAATCANCHGTNGVSVGEVDSLAGKPKDEIARKMQDFKAGRRPATVMGQLAKGYTDEQIELMAGWFAAQKPAK
jgi:cytochrome c553